MNEKWNENEWKISLTKTLFHRAKKTCSSEIFEIELNVIKELLIKNGYPNPLTDRVFKTEISRLNYIKFTVLRSVQFF